MRTAGPGEAGPAAGMNDFLTEPLALVALRHSLARWLGETRKAGLSHLSWRRRLGLTGLAASSNIARKVTQKRWQNRRTEPA